jgi:ubiquitin-activating enzyme E1 C
MIYFRQLRRPSISIGGGKALYWAAPPQLEASTRPNLSKTLKELLTGKDDLLVTDSSLPIELNLRVTLT